MLRFFFPLENEQYRKAAEKAQKKGGAQPSMSDFEIHPLAIEQTIERVSDRLGFIANRMILSAQIDCAPSLECDKNTGAFVQTGDNRVFLCHSWLQGTIAFMWTGSGDEARAHALLHEFARLTGATVRIMEGKEEKEPYTFRGTTWKTIQHKDALEAADAYAAFAWTGMRGS